MWKNLSKRLEKLILAGILYMLVIITIHSISSAKKYVTGTYRTTFNKVKNTRVNKNLTLWHIFVALNVYSVNRELELK